MSAHELITLEANSPHIGEKCPISQTAFKSGDSVVFCQKSNTFISEESISFMSGYCPMCKDYVNLSRETIPLPKPYYPSPGPRPRSTRIISLAAILLIGILLGATGIWAVINAQNNHNVPASTASIVRNDSASIDDKPIASPTPRSVSQPDPTATRKPDPTSRPTATRKPSPTSKPQPTSTPLVSRTEIEDLLDRWDEAHHQADRYWDTSQLNTVLYGDALTQQQETIRTLKNSNCYWVIRDLITPRISRFDIIDSNHLIVEVEKDWDMDKYCNGKKNGDDDGPFTMRYNIERINGRWYITQKQVSSN